VVQHPRWNENGLTSIATIPTGGGSVTSVVGDTTVTFPAGAFAQTVVITYTAQPPSSTGGLLSIGHFFDVTAVYSDTSQPASLQSGQTYTITVRYQEGKLGGVPEGSLGIYHWNGSAWVRDPTSVVDAVNNTVIATPDHLSLFAALGERRVYLPLVLKNYPAP